MMPIMTVILHYFYALLGSEFWSLIVWDIIIMDPTPGAEEIDSLVQPSFCRSHLAGTKLGSTAKERGMN